MNKTRNSSKHSSKKRSEFNITTRKYPGAIPGLNSSPSLKSVKYVKHIKTPNIGFVGNIVKQLPFTGSLVNLIKINKLNDAIKNKDTGKAIDLARTNINLDLVEGEEHPLFNCINYIIGKIPDHVSGILVQLILQRMTDYNKKYKTKSFLIYFFEKIVIDAADPRYEKEYLTGETDKSRTTATTFFTLLSNYVNLELKSELTGMNILDYILHPSFNISLGTRKELLEIIMNKNINLECDGVNALFRLCDIAYKGNYSAYAQIKDLITNGINVNVYSSDTAGVIYENYLIENKPAPGKSSPFYYNTTYITKFIPKKSQNDVKLNKLEPDKTTSPAIFMLKKIKSISEIMQGPKGGENKDKSEDVLLNEQYKNHCFDVLKLLIPVLTFNHLLLVIRHIVLNAMQYVIKDSRLMKLFDERVRSFMVYSKSSVPEYDEMWGVVKQIMDAANKEKENKDKDKDKDKNQNQNQNQKIPAGGAFELKPDVKGRIEQYTQMFNNQKKKKMKKIKKLTKINKKKFKKKYRKLETLLVK